MYVKLKYIFRYISTYISCAESCAESKKGRKCTESKNRHAHNVAKKKEKKRKKITYQLWKHTKCLTSGSI